MSKSGAFVAALVLSLSGCGESTPDPDRSAEAVATCERAVAMRLSVERTALAYDTSATRFGSGGWDVTGRATRAGDRPVSFACGVYADGDREDGPLRVDDVRVTADPE